MIISSPTLEQILVLAKKHRIIAMGEMHGVRENPEIVQKVIDYLKKQYSIIVGFEYPQLLLDWLDKPFEELKNTSPANFLIQDGRFSIYHYDLLKNLVNTDVPVFGFDLNTNEQNKQMANTLDWRDSIMARNINQILSNIPENQKVLLVTGDMHFQTKTQNVMYPDNTGTLRPVKYIPTGEQINVDSILALHLRYLSGEFYNKKLKPMPKITMVKESSFRDKDDLLEIDIESAHTTITN
ncbi:MAG: hypothetical protein UX08_C0003G0071 [Candidatus Collierbacteria bacterium GW2011_GWB1_45_35]|uniref:Haem-binding uptake Tiki superfamily ChaN domain-containing protein n=1 Tax=Candidatus Collierbacteria bacterium GW2011_GWB2_45_17 TaxID=1618388 RepID=A0A837IFF6_9BACT|nr:MAG: hypothetical protein UW48_C0006G0051 [Microgenomates group bacterium GW2011_GWC1_44_23]KKT96024.1 MAG: hypothetical protein UW96_C0002G0051 [Candidatus Collierbacteria bacterium GW2011_GWA1_45_15]KKU01103.1 MAG: hypothetical protein UX01_C0002G0069 [Candidatus Collierbacteria bacterium GW2011_GWB2_45_17]KKU05715.1 MAG: hypothetical protein UX08_C0003G0071 [Candidatus Collierbacteria bacterium GW2011_GWB1_45_35]KKU08086.1 MAG: hypothetical protein UX11_C0007G0051 [Candidatus Collierbacte